jgi:hypothetical protein
MIENYTFLYLEGNNTFGECLEICPEPLYYDTRKFICVANCSNQQYLNFTTK